jgi:hypothetical protein
MYVRISRTQLKVLELHGIQSDTKNNVTTYNLFAD